MKDPSQVDARHALRDLQEARVDDAAYYVELVLLLLKRCNDVEDRPTRSLGDLLREVEDQDHATVARRCYPPDDVLLAEPGWRRMCPAGEGWTRREPLTLGEALALAAERVK